MRNNPRLDASKPPNLETRRGLRQLLLVLVLTFVPVVLARGANSGKAPPAKVGQIQNESTLNTVTLTPEAARRLGIQLVAMERKRIPSARLLGGTVVAVAGRQVMLTAPLTGILLAPTNQAPGLRVGETVRAGQSLFGLSPQLAPEARVTLHTQRAEAEAEFQRVKAQVEPAKLAAARAEQLLKDKAGSVRAVEETRGAVEFIEASLRAVELRLKAITTALSPEAAAAPLVIPAPFAGQVRQLLAQPGQLVNTGMPLLELFDGRRVWLRVPVYVGDVPALDPVAEAGVGHLVPVPGETPRRARPIGGPQSATEGAATVDWYYEIDNADGALQPGQRLGVTIALREPEDALVVPWNAVLHDVNGGHWVYEQTAAHVFARRRVEVRRVAGTLAVLARGPQPGTLVVTDGAVELFGTEFGTGK